MSCGGAASICCRENLCCTAAFSMACLAPEASLDGTPMKFIWQWLPPRAWNARYLLTEISVHQILTAHAELWQMIFIAVYQTVGAQCSAADFKLTASQRTALSGTHTFQSRQDACLATHMLSVGPRSGCALQQRQQAAASTCWDSAPQPARECEFH